MNAFVNVFMRRDPHAGVGPTPRAYENWLFLGPAVIENERIRIIVIKVRQSTDLSEYIPAVVLDVLQL